ncbi:MAG: hypothetical protein AAGA99_20135 [Actinomycetota bacterium]
MDIIEILGWVGSTLVVASLSTAHPLRFRLLNLLAAVVLVVVNASVGLWSMVAMNAVIVALDVWHLGEMARHRQRRAPTADQEPLVPTA